MKAVRSARSSRAALVLHHGVVSQARWSIYRLVVIAFPARRRELLASARSHMTRREPTSLHQINGPERVPSRTPEPNEKYVRIGRLARGWGSGRVPLQCAGVGKPVVAEGSNTSVEAMCRGRDQRKSS